MPPRQARFCTKESSFSKGIQNKPLQQRAGRANAYKKATKTLY
jgi:hypothetical protein